MKVTIPDDWNGKDWSCVRVDWPNSPHWWAVFNGLLTYPLRGRYWDERSGRVTVAQAVAWEIFQRNDPLRGCGANQREAVESEETAGAGALIEGEEDDMGQVVTDLTIENGVLTVWYGKCCSKALTGFNTGENTIVDIGDTPYDPDGAGGVSYSACGKAKAIVDAIALVMQESYNVISTLSALYEIPFATGQVSNNVGIDLNDKWTWALLLAWFNLGAIISPDEAFGTFDQQKTVCALVNLFNNDATGVPDGETYDAIKASVQTQNFVYGYLVWDAISALGRENLDNIAKIGAANTSADCGCPEELIYPPVPVVGDWEHHYDFTQDDFGFTAEHGSWIAGRGFVVADIAKFAMGPGISKASASGGVLGYIALKIAWPTNYGGGGAGPSWASIGANELYWDASKVGQTWVLGETNKTFSGMAYFFTYQFTDDNVSGDCVLSAMVLSGTGTDPYPSDPA